MAELAGTNSRYLERIYHDVAGNAGIIVPDFVADESRRLPTLFPDAERENFQRYWDHLAEGTSYFSERYEEYIALFDKRLGAQALGRADRLKSARTNLIWYMSVVAIGQSVQTFDKYPLGGGTIDDMHELSLFPKTKSNRTRSSGLLMELMREHLVDTVQDPALVVSGRQNNLRYFLAPAAGGSGKKDREEKPVRQKKTSWAGALNPGL